MECSGDILNSSYAILHGFDAAESFTMDSNHHRPLFGIYEDAVL